MITNWFLKSFYLFNLLMCLPALVLTLDSITDISTYLHTLLIHTHTHTRVSWMIRPSTQPQEWSALWVSEVPSPQCPFVLVLFCMIAKDEKGHTYVYLLHRTRYPEVINSIPLNSVWWKLMLSIWLGKVSTSSIYNKFKCSVGANIPGLVNTALSHTSTRVLAGENIPLILDVG